MRLWPFGRSNKGAEADIPEPQVAEHQAPSVESWSEQDQKIHVVQKPGFELDIQMRAKVEATPSQVYAILTDPCCQNVFRGIKEVTHRETLEDDGKGKRMLEVGHKAVAKFLFIRVVFDTRLHVWEDDLNKTIKFKIAKQGFMKDFNGIWEVKPFTQATLDNIYKHHEEQPNPHPRFGFHFNPQAAFAAFQHHHSKPAEASATLLTLEQQIIPNHVPPGVVQNIVTRLTAHQVKTMMEDVRKEAKRRQDLASKGDTAKGQATAAPAASITLSSIDPWKPFVMPLEIVIRL